MNTSTRRKLCVLAILNVPCLVAGMAAAQTTNPNESAALQEIVVSSQRREERLQTVPVSVAAFDSEKLDSQGLRNMDDVARLTPGITFQRTGGASNNFNGEISEIAIRGIQSTAGAQTTGIYVDDTPIQGRHLLYSTVNAYPVLFDLERVEVLRGPQGTLFGSGSEGGTVRFISPEPNLRDYSVYSRAEFTTTDGGAPGYEVGAAFGAPVIHDRLAFRVSASSRWDGGWVDRVSYVTHLPEKNNSNSHKMQTLHAALKFAPTDALTIIPSIYYQKLHVSDTSAYWVALSDPHNGVFVNGNLVPNSSIDPFLLSSLKVDWNVGPLRIISNTSYFTRDQRATTDFTTWDRDSFAGNPYTTPTGIGYQYSTDSQENYVEELRVQSSTQSRLTWIGGVFIGHMRENSNQLIQDPSLPADVRSQAGSDMGPLLPGGYWYVQQPFQIIDKQFALFGQADYEIGAGVKLTLGVRASRVTFDGHGVVAYNPSTAPLAQVTASKTEHPVTPKVGLSWQINPNDMIYATVAKGVRMGGINSSVAPSCASDLTALGYPNGTPPTYDSDNVWSYEVGAKNLFWNHRLQINGSLYWIDWKNIQQSIFLPSCGYAFTANLGGARSRGGDIDAQLLVTPGLTLGVTAGYTDAQYTKTIAGAIDTNVVTSGDHLVSSPWTAAVSGEYVLQTFGERHPYLRVDYQLSTSQTGRTQVQNPENATYDRAIPSLPETKALSARAGVRWNGWDVSLFGNNLLNTHPLLYTSHNLKTSPLFYGYTWRPRSLGLTATYRW